MKPRKRVHKPLLGFGSAGYILLAIFLALLVPTLAGVDLRYTFLEVLIRFTTFDLVDETLKFVIFLSWSNSGAGVSYLTAIIGVVAFQVSPYKANKLSLFLWYTFNVMWHQMLPYTRRLRSDLLDVLGIELSIGWQVAIWYCLGIVISGLWAWRLTRSRLVAAAWAISLIGAAAELMFVIQWNSTFWNRPLLDSTYAIRMNPSGILFTFLTSGSLLLWAILERRKPIPKSLCPTCDYDLAGLSPSSPCPECGKITSTGNQKPSGAVVHAEGVNHDPKPDNPSPSPEG